MFTKSDSFPAVILIFIKCNDAAHQFFKPGDKKKIFSPHSCTKYMLYTSPVTFIILFKSERIVHGLNSDRKSPAPTSPTDIFHVQELSSMFLQVRTAFGLRLQYSWAEFRLYVQVDEPWKDDTVGLCGTFNGNIQDDFL